MASFNQPASTVVLLIFVAAACSDNGDTSPSQQATGGSGAASVTGGSGGKAASGGTGGAAATGGTGGVVATGGTGGTAGTGGISPECTEGYGRTWGNAQGAVALSNRQLQPNNNTKIAIGFISKGTRIDSITLAHMYTPGTNSGYSNGNGGTLKYTVQRANSAGLPDGNPIAQTGEIIAAPAMWSSQSAAAAAHPGAIWTQHGESGTTRKFFRKIDLQSPVSVSLCEHLFIVAEQVSGGTSNWISINSNRDRTSAPILFDPFFDSARDWCVWVYRDGKWIDESNSSSQGYIASFQVTGDVTYGTNYHEAASPPDIGVDATSRNTRINSGKSARWAWTPPRDMKISGAIVAAAHVSGANSVTVTLRQNGSVLGSTVISDFVTASANDYPTVHSAIGSKKSDFSSAIDVQGGVTLYCELTSSGEMEIGTGRNDTGYLGGPNDELHHGFSGETQANTGSGWSTSTGRGKLSVMIQEYADGVNSCLEDHSLCQ